MTETLDTITAPSEEDLLTEQIAEAQARLLELRSQRNMETRRATRETNYNTLHDNVARTNAELENHKTVRVPTAHAALDAAIVEIVRASAGGYTQAATSPKVMNAVSAVLAVKIAELRCEDNLAKLQTRFDDETRVREAAKPKQDVEMEAKV